jgi:hypothetical protein
MQVLDPVSRGTAAPLSRLVRLGRRWELPLTLGLVGLVAAFFRLYHLPTVPPGLHHDEGVNGLDVLITIPQQHPIFFALNNGREPLFIYLQALSVALFGPSAFSLRLAAAVVGIVTVLAVYGLARAWFGREVALVAALGLATAFWHVDLSRIGLRAIGAPLFETLTLWFLWRGFRSGRQRDFALGGLALSLGLYTYLSGRVVPFVVVGIVVWEAIRNWSRLRRRLSGLALFVVVAVVATAPLGRYFVQHPEYFVGRSDQVWIFNPNPSIETTPVSFEVNAERTLGMFFVAGDRDPRQNLPGRPVFDRWAAPWFVLGLVLLLWQVVAALVRRRRAAVADSPASVAQTARITASGAGLLPDPDVAAWLLLWLASLLALGMVTYESPDFLRLSAMVPAVYLIWAAGLVTAGRWLAGRLAGHSALAAAGVTALVLALVGFEAGRTYVDYFDVWAVRGDVYEGFDAGLTAAARYVERAVPAGTPLFFYVDRSPPIQFQSPKARAGTWLQEYSNLLVLPRSSARGAVYVFNGDGSLSHTPSLYFAHQAPSARDVDPAGNLGFVAYRLSPAQVGAWARPAVPRTAIFGAVGSQVELLGYTLDSTTVGPRQQFGLTLVWRVLTDSHTVYAPYMHVLDATGRSWGQDDREGYVPAGWQRGDLFLSRHQWTVPVGTPPLTYRLEVGMAVRAIGFPPGPPVALGSPIDLTQIQVSRNSVVAAGQPLPPMAHSLSAPVGGGLVLRGYDAPTGPVTAGQPFGVDLLWTAAQPPGRDLWLTLSLVDAEGKVWASRTGRPAYGEFPTADWPADVVLRDPWSLTVPGQAPAGPLQLKVAVSDAAGAPLGQATLGTIAVVEPPRSFQVPAVQHPVDANFGGQIALRGFDLDASAAAPGSSAHLVLYWQAESAPHRNYTVFTHLLDAQNHIVAQQDSPPDGGTAPTLGWVTGQVVRDAHTLQLPATLPPGSLTLEVGLYDPTNGQRLSVVGNDAGDRVVLLRLPVRS